MLSKLCTYSFSSNKLAGLLLLDLSKDLVVAEQDVLVVANLDRGATERRDKNAVARLDSRRNDLALRVLQARAGRDNVSDVQLLNVLLRDIDTRGSLGLRLGTLDEDAVQEGHNALDVTNAGHSSVKFSDGMWRCGAARGYLWRTSICMTNRGSGVLAVAETNADQESGSAYSTLSKDCSLIANHERLRSC